MAKEVRCVLFTRDEVRNVVAGFLSRKGQKRSLAELERVELTQTDGPIAARVHLIPQLRAEPIDLDATELQTAVLMFCGGRNIPLSKRSQKKLEASNDGLVLVMTMNLELAHPSVTGTTVQYTTGPDQDFVDHHVQADLHGEAA